MTSYDLTLYYKVPVETWDEATCAKMAKATWRDGMGTPCPIKGLQVERRGCPVRYNGGCTREGDWYPGEIFSLPILAKGYEWVQVPTWGWRIVRGPVVRNEPDDVVLFPVTPGV